MVAMAYKPHQQAVVDAVHDLVAACDEYQEDVTQDELGHALAGAVEGDCVSDDRFTCGLAVKRLKELAADVRGTDRFLARFNQTTP